MTVSLHAHQSKCIFLHHLAAPLAAQVVRQ